MILAECSKLISTEVNYTKLCRSNDKGGIGSLIFPEVKYTAIGFPRHPLHPKRIPITTS